MAIVTGVTKLDFLKLFAFNDYCGWCMVNDDDIANEDDENDDNEDFEHELAW